MTTVAQPGQETWTDGTDVDEHGPLGHSAWAKDERERRRRRVAELLHLRRTTTEIHVTVRAEGFVCSRAAVGVDIKLVRERNALAGSVAYSRMVADETAKLDDLEALCWSRLIDAPEVNGAVLNGMLRLMERRARLHGLDMPTRVETTLAVTEVTAQLRQKFLIQLGITQPDAAGLVLDLPSAMIPPVRDDSALRAAMAALDDDEDDPDDDIDERYDDADLADEGDDDG